LNCEIKLRLLIIRLN